MKEAEALICLAPTPTDLLAGEVCQQIIFSLSASTSVIFLVLLVMEFCSVFKYIPHLWVARVKNIKMASVSCSLMALFYAVAIQFSFLNSKNALIFLNVIL